ncbi:uncharacterized protein LOC120263488 [Dioscorea cayenensis subsp. rotundata]|uniref:Uncharacterized protein LOC120263488 n=1 Tax=Dioscorea cayennensis subsp. rotundata TaxID=55577 RepID=A0AB40BJB9_DIOCR|nr:uncharacterized protein LOC120263488 [Dioscorea cayenensis subsp. rotundata]
MECPARDSVAGERKEEACGATVAGAYQIDPFLIEALQNPRHRLTVLRMELDIQRFMQNPGQNQFEFQHFPTSYLRCAAHRVAQYYGLQTMSLDNVSDGLVSRILAIKTQESRFPPVYLSEIPVKQSEIDSIGQVKIAIRTRPNKTSSGDTDELGRRVNPARTMEERMEEYDKARARIFSASSGLEGESLCMIAPDEKSMCENPDEQEYCRTWIEESERACMKDGASRVAIFRDREKDRHDPDYDRSYNRYARNLSYGQNFNLGAPNLVQPPLLQYEAGFPQLAQLPRVQPSVSYPAIINPFCASGGNKSSGDTVYMQWPSPTMLYAHSYEHFRHAVFQPPSYQQPLSFDHSQNY